MSFGFDVKVDERDLQFLACICVKINLLRNQGFGVNNIVMTPKKLISQGLKYPTNAADEEFYYSETPVYENRSSGSTILL